MKGSAGRALRCFAIAAIVIGSGLRIATTRVKAFWRDETTTALRLAGYSDLSVAEELCRSGGVTPQALLRYQDPSLHGSLAGTIRALVEEGGHHPPLYYLIARLWALAVGASPEALRALSVLLGFAALWLIYRLSLELFQDESAAWISVTLLSLCPIVARYATEARDYSCWMAALLAAGLTLLRALRLGTRSTWALYAASAAASLYAFPLSALLLVGHLAFVLAIEDFKTTKALRACGLALAAAAASFLPWALIMSRRMPLMLEANAWSAHFPGLRILGRLWMANAAGTFYETEYLIRRYILLNSLVVPACAAFLAFSVYHLALYRSKKVSLFVLTYFVPFLTFALSELATRQGCRSTIHRYNFPLYMGAILAASHCLAATGRGALPLPLRRAALGLFAALGGGSIAAYLGVGFKSQQFVHAAAAVDAAGSPFVICPLDLRDPLRRQTSLGDAMALSRGLRKDAIFAFQDVAAPAAFPPEDKTALIFAYDGSEPTTKGFVLRAKKPGFTRILRYGSMKGNGPQLWALAGARPRGSKR